jgi:hypothetical protein
MKKLLIVLLALTVLGIFAFAQDAAAPAVTLGATVKTGFQFGAVGSGDTTGQLYESDDPTSTRADISATISGTAGGAAITFRGENATAAGQTVTVPTVYGWWKPVTMLNIKAGIDHGIIWETPIEGWDNGDTGLQVVLSPIDGLTFGADYYLTEAATKVGKDYFGISASYAAKDLVTVGFNADFAKKYFFGANVTAVKDLTAMVDVGYDDTGVLSPDAITSIEEQVGYVFGALSPYVRGYETLYKDYNDIAVKVAASYAMGSYTPGAYFKYVMPGTDGYDSFFQVGANLDVAADKNSVHIYADYNSLKDGSGSATDLKSWDFGFRYIVSL